MQALELSMSNINLTGKANKIRYDNNSALYDGA